MKDELAKPENAGLKLVATVYGNDDDQKSFQETQGLLQAHPNLKAIISPTTRRASPPPPATSAAPSYKGKVAVTGLGMPNQMREYVKDGTVDAVRAVGPGPRLPRRLRGGVAGLRPDHRRRGREVHGRQARRVHDRRRRRDRARPADGLHGREHRPVQVLSLLSPVPRPGAGLRSTTPDRTASASDELHMHRYCFLLQVRPDGSTSTASGTARSGRRCSPRCATPAGATTRSSCATTACWSATSRPTTSPPRRPRWRPPRSTPAGRPRWRSSSPASTAGARTRGSCVLDEVFHLENPAGTTTESTAEATR